MSKKLDSKKYIVVVHGGVSTPNWNTELYVPEEMLETRLKEMAREFVGVRWFISLNAYENGDKLATSVRLGETEVITKGGK